MTDYRSVQAEHVKIETSNTFLIKLGKNNLQNISIVENK